MPPENDFPALDGSAPDRVRNTVGRGSNMIAYKPRGERGPTVYRDTTDIPPEHMARLNSASARFVPRESAQVEQPAPAAPLASDVPQPDASAESVRASQLSMPQIAVSILLVQAALVGLQQELHRRAAALKFSRRRPDVTFLGEVLPGIMEPSGDGVVFGDESNPMPILSDAEELRKYLEDLKKRGEEEKAKMAEEEAQRRNRTKPESANGAEVERPTGSSDDLFPWNLADAPPKPLSGFLDADDLPPTYVPVPPPTPFDLFEEERKQREVIRKLLEAKGTFVGPQPWQKPVGLPRIVYQDPPKDAVEELKRQLEQPQPLYRPGTGTLGPFYLPGFEPLPIGLWGGGSLSGKGVAGGAFIGPIPFLGPSSVRLYFGPSAELGGAFPGFGGEVGISINIR